MAFTVLAADTTISVAEVNDNFLHIGQGDLVPRTGTSLAIDDSVTSNLGEDTHRWRTIYTTNVDVSGEIEGTVYRIAGVTATATAASISITGLNGDEGGGVFFIRAVFLIDGTGSAGYYWHLNQDSASNYGYRADVGLSV